jgi:hypothetical protein
MMDAIFIDDRLHETSIPIRRPVEINQPYIIKIVPNEACLDPFKKYKILIINQYNRKGDIIKSSVFSIFEIVDFKNDEYLLKYDEYKDFYFDGSSTNHQEYQSYLNYIRTPIIREIRLNHLLK